MEELQKTFDVNLAEIATMNHEFIQKFPFSHIPMYVYESFMDSKKAMLDMSQRSDDSKDGINAHDLGVIQEQYQHSCSKFDIKDIQRLKETIASEEVRRIAGLLCHFIYWIVFGLVNPLPVDKLSRKQMIVLILQLYNEVLQKFNKK